MISKETRSLGVNGVGVLMVSTFNWKQELDHCIEFTVFWLVQVVEKGRKVRDTLGT